MSEHVEKLLADWTQRIAESEPGRVLDVGCGRGRVLELLRERKIEALGLEAGEARLRELAERGLDFREGSALELPFEDKSFDTVALRHVLHHLSDHELALKEAARVARKQLWIAEPCYETRIDSQAAGDRLDRWHKRQHETTETSVHRNNLLVHELLASIHEAVGEEPDIELGRYLPLTRWSVDEVERRFGPFAAKLPSEDPERELYAELLEMVRSGAMTRGGSLWIQVKL
ncbi:MAG: hypothetical protein CSA62_01700 [Planctomycetota bacterium]|nr:MAG: hypothetical protein CSA62_01700 [Planctomycetota bacterium]